MPVHNTLKRSLAALLVALAPAAQAGVIEGADVAGFRTFVDTQTGTVWADLDNHLAFGGNGLEFRFADRSAYLGALSAAGFTWAFSAQVQALLDTLPLSTSTEFLALGPVMGSLAFGETNTLDAYSNATDGLALRQYGQVSFSAGTASWAMGSLGPLPNALNDAGLWAYLAGPVGSVGGGGGSVPLPGTLALAGLGLLGVAAPRRSPAQKL